MSAPSISSLSLFSPSEPQIPGLCMAIRLFLNSNSSLNMRVALFSHFDGILKVVNLFFPAVDDDICKLDLRLPLIDFVPFMVIKSESRIYFLLWFEEEVYRRIFGFIEIDFDLDCGCVR
jgi:hypothetical protein